MARRVIPLIVVALCGCTTIDAIPKYPDRTSADLARERYFEAIFDRPADDWVATAPDLQAIRHIVAAAPMPPAKPRYAEPEPLDFTRIFSRSDMAVGEIMAAIEATSRYRFVVDPAFDASMKVSLNDQYNRIDDVLEYLGRKTGSTMILFESASRILVVHGRHTAASSTSLEGK